MKPPRFNSNEWSILWGLVTGALALVLWPLASAIATHAGHPAHSLPASRWHVFWGLSLVLATGALWLGNGLWNAAAKRLPLTLSGQMIVFETLFGLLYGFAYAGRAPRPLEWAALLLLLGIGVSGSVRAHAGRGAHGPAEGRM